MLAAGGGGGSGPPLRFVSIPPDWSTRGRPYKVYAIGLPVVLAQQVLTVPFAATSAWMAFIKRFERLAG